MASLQSSGIYKEWQDGFNKVLSANGVVYRAEKANFPKLWMRKEDDNTESEVNTNQWYFSPRAGVVYTTTKEASPTVTLCKSRLHKANLIIPAGRETSTLSTLSRKVSWKESDDPSKRSCRVYISGKHHHDFWGLDDTYEVNSPMVKIFSFGSPLKDSELRDVKFGQYCSTDFLPKDKYGAGLLSSLPKIAETALSVLSLFGSAGFKRRRVIIGTPYGESGFDTVMHNSESVPTSLDSTFNTNILPSSMQSRGQLYPRIERIKLAKSKKKGLEVWQFRTSRSNSMFLGVNGTKLEDKDLLKDKPRKWYLMENPRDTEENPYVLGIGLTTMTIHFLPDTAVSIPILSDSDVFEKGLVQSSLKVRGERVVDSTSLQESSTTHLTGAKLKNVIEELASKVSYKTFATMLQRVTPEGKDPTLTFHYELEGGVQEVQLVLYAVTKKHLRFLGTIGENKISHLVAVWWSDELIDAYWASPKSTLYDALSVVHEVKEVMQMGGAIPETLIRAELDVEFPATTFSDLSGEYGAAVREACAAEFERSKASTHNQAFGFSLGDAGKLLANVAQNVASSGIVGGRLKDVADTGVITTAANAVFGFGPLLGPAIGLVKSIFFGLSPDEPNGKEYDVAFQKTFGDSGTQQDNMQPYLKVNEVYDQKPRDTCVLCSIGHTINLLTENNSLNAILKSLNEVIPADKVPYGGLVITSTLNELVDVLDHYDLEWTRIQPIVQNIKNSLDQGLPIIVGAKFDDAIFQYQNNLEEPLSGPFSGPGKPELMHCVTIIGYDDADSTFTVLNSWGASWGRYGAMLLEQDYGGFDRAFIFTKKATAFGARDVSSNTQTVRFE